MKRAISVLLLALMPMTINEMPSCGGSKGGGSGDINHPNVLPINPPKPTYIPKPGDKPRIKGDAPRVINFQATWDPERDMHLTWRINGKGETWKDTDGFWEHEELAEKGDMAEFIVENLGRGGATTCAIYVNGTLFAPRSQSDHHPFNESLGAGDCRASILVP